MADRYPSLPQDFGDNLSREALVEALDAVVPQGDASIATYTLPGALAEISFSQDAAYAADARLYGVQADAVRLWDVTLTSGSNIVASAHVFTNTDVGKQFVTVSATGVIFTSTILGVAGGFATLAANASYSGLASFAVFGTDDTANLNRAFLSGYPIRMPLTPMLVSDAINVTLQDQRIYFPSRITGGFFVSPRFNMAAAAVLNLNVVDTSSGSFATGANAGPEIWNVRIVFAQPDSITVGQYIAYPPAIAGNAQRVRFHGGRIVAGWVGVQCRNCAGMTFYDLEVACFGVNVSMDGVADTMRFLNTHIWPIELTANQFAPFMAPGCIGWEIGRADDYWITSGLTICGAGAIIQEGGLAAPLNGASFGGFVNHDFDTFGTIGTYCGTTLFIGCCVTLGPFATPAGSAQPSFGLQKGGDSVVIMSGCEFLLTSTTTSGFMIEDDSLDAAFTGSIAGNILTITAITAGRIGFGAVVGTGVAAGTTIMQQLSGPKALTGTYLLSVSQTVASRAMTSPLTRPSLLINGCTIDGYNVDESLVVVNGPQAKVNVTGCMINKTPNIAYATSMIIFNAGRGSVTGNTFSAAGTGTSNAIAAVNVGTKVVATGNNLGGYTTYDNSTTSLFSDNLA